MRKKIVCFSGHRPEKLPGKGKNNQLTRDIKSLIYYSIYESINQGYTCFMSGLARGIDIWAALCVIEMKALNPDIKLISVKPFRQHDESFKGQDLEDLEKVLENSDKIVCTSEYYCKEVYKIRNRYMVEHSDKLIAFVNNYRSGTGQTIHIAEKLGIDMKVIDLKEFNEKYHEALEKGDGFRYNIL